MEGIWLPLILFVAVLSRLPKGWEVPGEKKIFLFLIVFVRLSHGFDWSVISVWSESFETSEFGVIHWKKGKPTSCVLTCDTKSFVEFIRKFKLFFFKLSVVQNHTNRNSQLFQVEVWIRSEIQAKIFLHFDYHQLNSTDVDVLELVLGSSTLLKVSYPMWMRSSS